MYNQISASLNEFIDNKLSLDAGQKKTLRKKQKLTLSDSLKKGHWTSNLCLIASNLAKINPQDVASALIPILESHSEIAKVELAGPGFVNIFLTREAFLNQLDNAHDDPTYFLNSSDTSKEKNTDRICFSESNWSIACRSWYEVPHTEMLLEEYLERLGHEVSREYYVNDAGRQIDILACSIFLRKFECFDEDQFPGSAYKGSYILEIADAIEINIGMTETEKESSNKRSARRK